MRSDKVAIFFPYKIERKKIVRNVERRQRRKMTMLWVDIYTLIQGNRLDVWKKDII